MTIAAPAIPKKRIKHVGNKSCGRMPTVYANEDIPSLASEGNVKRTLGRDWSIKMGDAGSASWFEKPVGGAKGSV